MRVTLLFLKMSLILACLNLLVLIIGISGTRVGRFVGICSSVLVSICTRIGGFRVNSNLTSLVDGELSVFSSNSLFSWSSISLGFLQTFLSEFSLVISEQGKEYLSRIRNI